MVCSDAIEEFFARARKRPAHSAVVEEGEGVSYEALAWRARCLAQVFARVTEPRALASGTRYRNSPINGVAFRFT